MSTQANAVIVLACDIASYQYEQSKRADPMPLAYKAATREDWPPITDFARKHSYSTPEPVAKKNI